MIFYKVPVRDMRMEVQVNVWDHKRNRISDGAGKDAYIRMVN